MPVSRLDVSVSLLLFLGTIHTIMMKFQFVPVLYYFLAHSFDTAVASTTTTLSESGRALLESRIIDQLDENAKRCLVDETIDADLCQGILLDPSLHSSNTKSTTTNTGIVHEHVISEASYEVESPAPLEGDNIGSDLGEPQVIESYNQADVVEVIRQARLYMQEVVYKDPQYDKVRSHCKNDNAQCAFWASIGECDKVRDNKQGWDRVVYIHSCQLMLTTPHFSFHTEPSLHER